MPNVRTVTLQLVRPGPAHNQLLSPLTPYIALCGAEAPVTVNVPFEHQQLLMRLNRLRYSDGGREIPPEQREAEVVDIGKVIGNLLTQVPTLISELAQARCNGDLVHLQLSVSALELAVVPFEFVIAADGFPNSGSPLFLQSRHPICLTREVRRGQPLPVQWNRSPKILFAFANLPGLPVPAQAHLNALRHAIDPWLMPQFEAGESPEDQRVNATKKLITILPSVSLKKLRESCAAAEYTHVHILAHGLPYKEAGNTLYGVALHGESDGGMEVIDGERLAMALMPPDSTGGVRPRPSFVNLATCDSGNSGAVPLTTGGSIAQQLHGAGIPWVVASQFPLYKSASTIAVEILFSGILDGRDPRVVLYELRQRLRTESGGTHDWASIVTYAAVSPGFDSEVDEFRNRQTRARVNARFGEAEMLRTNQKESAPVSENAADVDEAMARLYHEIRDRLERWRGELPADAPDAELSERVAMQAAAEKRIGGLQGKEADRQNAYRKARDLYFEAVDVEPSNSWALTQALAMTAVLASGDPTNLPREYGHAWTTAMEMARRRAKHRDHKKQIWALSDIAELKLLGNVYGSGANESVTAAEIEEICVNLRQKAGADEFYVNTTKLQFRRYLSRWNMKSADGTPWSVWENLAKRAVKALDR